MEKINLSDVQKTLTPEIVRVMQIIYFTIMAGASFFFLVVIFTYLRFQQQTEVNRQSVEIINILSIIHAAVFLSCLALSIFIPKMLLSKINDESKIKDVKKSIDIANSYIALIRTAKIIFLALLEAPAFLGLVICFIAITGNVIFRFTYYWLNALSYFVLIYLAVKDFPTKDKILNIFKTELNYLLKY